MWVFFFVIGLHSGAGMEEAGQREGCVGKVEDVLGLGFRVDVWDLPGRGHILV